MTAPLLALYTFGQFINPSEHPSNQGFHDRNDANLAAVDRARGLVARSGYAGEAGPESWGLQVYPAIFADPNGDGWAPSTLSLWQDAESIWAYTYSGIHAEALTNARQWFQKGDWPPLVLWWTESRPDWAEAVRRYDHLRLHGPSPQAFGFRQMFDAQGATCTVDRARVRSIAALNSEGSV